MTITNGYTTLAEVKARMDITSTDAADDAVIEALVEQASRLVDILTMRTFYARTETHYYDAPCDGYNLLIMDDDLLTVTSITNGNGETIASGTYFLLPANKTPKYKIRLKDNASITLDGDDDEGDTNAITIVGTWGYAASAPDDVQGAVEEIVANAYRRRTGNGQQGITTVTGGGVVITPEDVPASVLPIINHYKRLV